MMKFTAKLLSVVLVLAMVLSMGVFAFAGEGGSSNINIVKNVHIPDKSSSKPTEYFAFHFTPVSVSEKTPAGENLAGEMPLPDLSLGFDQNVEYNYSSGSTACTGTKALDNVTLSYIIDKSDAFTVGETYYFEWVVSEVKGTTEGMTYDSARYLLVSKLQVESINNDLAEDPNKMQLSGQSIFYFYTEDGEEKVENMTFNNTYMKPAETRLKVSNTVTDSSMEPIPNKAFAYTMMVNKPDLWPEDSFSYNVFDKNGNLLKDQSGTANYGEPFTFNLDDGYYATLVLPEGCWYDILETGAKNYKPSVMYGDDEDEINDFYMEGNYDENIAIPQNDPQVTSTPQIRVDNGGSHVFFFNEKRDVSPTGLIINNLPYIVIVVIAALGIAVFCASGKRRQSED
ncbi:MAG: hypothetical protein Q4F31_09190 [Eubacteriales bacterium]|nr:hypothetical protein [Eubacteriales bacterium]